MPKSKLGDAVIHRIISRLPADFNEQCYSMGYQHFFVAGGVTCEQYTDIDVWALPGYEHEFDVQRNGVVRRLFFDHQEVQFIGFQKAWEPAKLLESFDFTHVQAGATFEATPHGLVPGDFYCTEDWLVSLYLKTTRYTGGVSRERALKRLDKFATRLKLSKNEIKINRKLIESFDSKSKTFPPEFVEYSANADTIMPLPTAKTPR